MSVCVCVLDVWVRFALARPIFFMNDLFVCVMWTCVRFLHTIVRNSGLLFLLLSTPTMRLLLWCFLLLLLLLLLLLVANSEQFAQWVFHKWVIFDWIKHKIWQAHGGQIRSALLARTTFDLCAQWHNRLQAYFRRWWPIMTKTTIHDSIFILSSRSRSHLATYANGNGTTAVRMP